MISSVTDDNGVTVTNCDNLNQFQKRNTVWTNDFWALDTKVNGEPYKSNSSFGGGSHNYFFGMYYTFNFKLGDYTGPLTYCFCGDDDFWLFVDGKLAVDLGGIHDPMGRVIDLYDFIDTEDKDATHEIVIYYLERGGNASTCYMEFTIPNVTVLPTFPEKDLTEVSVEKVWENSDGSEITSGLPEKVDVTLWYKNADADDSAYERCRFGVLDEDHDWTCKWNLPKGYDYKVTETPVNGYETSYSNSNGELVYNEKTKKYEVTITNTKKQAIAVEKVWVDGTDGSVLVNEERPDSVTARLYWRPVGSSGAYEAYRKSDNSYYDLVLNSGNNWNGSFEDLPVFYPGGEAKAEYYVYELDPADSNNLKVLDTNGILPSKTGKAGYAVSYSFGKSSFTITNTLRTVEFKLHKVGKKGDTIKDNALQGATFTLSRANSSMTWSAQTTGTDGKLTFSGLPGGTYTLTETNAPDGYSIAGPWTFTISRDGTITFADHTPDGGGWFTIENQAGVELPETGGPGLIMMERFGWMLLLLAMLGAEIQIFGSKRRREE